MTHAELLARGCTCGDENVVKCPLHASGDNRGIRAWFEAGMPLGFPSPCRCMVCGADGLLYPNVELDDPKRSGGYRPTVVCPRCSTPAVERWLRMDAEEFGYELNGSRVFGQAVAA
jgi:hypothetical protein